MQELSVIVPITKMSGRLGNLATWLPDAIEHGVNVILIHDKQDDATATELRVLTESFNSPKIKMLEARVGSPGGARNLGFPLVDSRWVAFWDSDDLPIVPHALKAIAEAGDEVDAICCQYRISRNHKSQAQSGTCNKKQLVLNPGIWRIFLRTNFLEHGSFTDLLMGEDQVYLLEIGLYRSRILFSNVCTYTYFVGDSNQATRNVKSINDLQRGIVSLQNSYDLSDHFANLIILRMTLTLIRKANPKVRIWAIFNFFRIIRRNLISLIHFVLVRNYE